MAREEFPVIGRFHRACRPTTWENRGKGMHGCYAACIPKFSWHHLTKGISLPPVN